MSRRSRGFGHDTKQLAAMVRGLDHPNIKMCFDTGHANMAGNAVAAAESCLDLTFCTHVNDNGGKLDEHGIPGTGSCPWDDLGRVFCQSFRRLFANARTIHQ